MTDKYVVMINDPYRSNVEKFFHDNSVVFAKKAAEGGAVYIAEMNQKQKDSLLKRFKSVIVQELEEKVEGNLGEITADDEFAFPHVEPDMPEGDKMGFFDKVKDFVVENKYWVAAAVALVIVLVLVF